MKPIKGFIITISLYIFTLFISFLLSVLKSNSSLLTAYSNNLFNMNQITILLISLFIFLTFKNIKLKNNKYINYISSATFGVYLIHDSNLIRPILWHNIFNAPQYTRFISLALYSFFAIISIYIVCTVIELIRKKILEDSYMKIIDKKLDKNR